MTNLSYAATYLFEKSQSADATKLLQIQNNIEDIIFDYSRRTNKDGFVKTLLFDKNICDATDRDANVCTACVSVCESSAIVFDGAAKQISISFADCTACQKCVSVCPTGALEESEYNLEVMVAMLEACEGRGLLVASEADLVSFAGEVPDNTVIFCAPNYSFLNELYLSLFAFKTGGAVYFTSKEILPATLQESIENTNRLFEAFGKKAVSFVSEGVSSQRSFEPIAKRFENMSLRTAITEGFKALEAFGTANVESTNMFASVNVDDRCTLCMGCAFVCKSGAFYADEKEKALTLNESLCTGCGHCESICPEKSIVVTKGLFRSEKSYFEFKSVAKDELFCCVECGKPFATSKAIAKVASVFSGIFLDEDKKRTLYCCADCKPKIMLRDFAARSAENVAR